MFRLFLLTMLVVSPAFAQEDGPPPPKETKKEDTKKEDAPKKGGAGVAGLELPPDQAVNFDEGFVNLQAKCSGEVKWLVTAAVKIKYITVPQTKSIIISIPPTGGAISVFAVGLVDGKLTDFARTNITVSGGPGPGPTPPPNPPNPPNPPQPSAKLHVTFLIDMNSATPQLGKLLNSETLRKGVTQRGHWFRLYDIKSPIVVAKHLDQVAQRVGGNAVMIIQSDDGKVLDARAIPASEGEVFNVISQITGK